MEKDEKIKDLETEIKRLKRGSIINSISIILAALSLLLHLIRCMC